MRLNHWRNYLLWLKIKSRQFFYAVRENFGGRIHYLQLQQLSNKAKCVLLVEFHNWHGETLPGYVKYFRDLGYDVQVITRLGIYLEKPFCRFEPRVNHRYMTVPQIRQFLSSEIVKKFAYCLVASDPLWFNMSGGYWQRVVDYVGCLPAGQKGGGIIIHDLADGNINPAPVAKNWSMEKLLQHTFTLTAADYHNVSVPMLNPYYFGNVKSSGKHIDTVTFITVGSIKKSKRNFDELFNALRQLKGNWCLNVVGNVDDPACLENISDRVKILGRLDFPSMYKELEQADFLLPLLDPDFKEHQPYLHSCTSGSRQLILGFSIIPVIHRAFGEHYGFTDKNAILYESGQLSRAMQQAIDLSETQYSLMTAELQKEAASVQTVSLENLRKRLPPCC